MGNVLESSTVDKKDIIEIYQKQPSVEPVNVKPSQEEELKILLAKIKEKIYQLMAQQEFKLQEILSLFVGESIIEQQSLMNFMLKKFEQADFSIGKIQPFSVERALPTFGLELSIKPPVKPMLIIENCFDTLSYFLECTSLSVIWNYQFWKKKLCVEFQDVKGILYSKDRSSSSSALVPIGPSSLISFEKSSKEHVIRLVCKNNPHYIVKNSVSSLPLDVLKQFFELYGDSKLKEVIEEHSQLLAQVTYKQLPLTLVENKWMPECFYTMDFQDILPLVKINDAKQYMVIKIQREEKCSIVHASAWNSNRHWSILKIQLTDFSVTLTFEQSRLDSFKNHVAAVEEFLNTFKLFGNCIIDQTSNYNIGEMKPTVASLYSFVGTCTLTVEISLLRKYFRLSQFSVMANLYHPTSSFVSAQCFIADNGKELTFERFVHCPITIPNSVKHFLELNLDKSETVYFTDVQFNKYSVIKFIESLKWIKVPVGCLQFSKHSYHLHTTNIGQPKYTAQPDLLEFTIDFVNAGVTLKVNLDHAKAQLIYQGDILFNVATDYGATNAYLGMFKVEKYRDVVIETQYH